MKQAELLDQEAFEVLVSALQLAGVEISPASTRLSDLELSWEGRHVRVEVKRGSQITGTKALELTAERSQGRRKLLVADRITADARTMLTEAGWSWLDRRGWLHLRAPGLLVDREVPAPPSPANGPVAPIRGRAGVAVAYWLCAHPGETLSPTKSGLGMAPSTISTALTDLRAVGLADAQRRGVFPELFWELATVWRPRWTWLASAPSPEDAWDAERGTAWVRVDDRAAQHLGAPVFSLGDGPVALLVPGPVAVTIAARRYGVAPAGTGAATVAVAPAHDVFTADNTDALEGWRIAPPLALALQLASTGARGREILTDWSVPDSVWS